MTLDEWMRCGTKPAVMFRAGRTSPRKRQLLACALARLIPPTALEPWAAEALDHAEQFADGDLPSRKFRRTAGRVRAASEDLEMQQAMHGDVPEESVAVATAVLCVVGTADLTKSIPALMEHVQRHDQLTAPRGSKTKARAAMLARQCAVVREIMLHTDMDCQPAIGATGSAIYFPRQRIFFNVPPIARGIAESIQLEQAYDRLPVLADALEEHGLTDAPLLEHLRGGGPHTRGCWALDLILGRG